MKRLIITLLISTLFISCSDNKKIKENSELEKKINQYSKTELTFDESLLDERQKIVVSKLYEAGKIIDRIFLDQVYSKNEEIEEILLKSKEPSEKIALEYFRINFGPFDRLDHNNPFYEEITKPKGANFYPEDMTKEEFEKFLKDNPEKEAEFTSEFTVIRRENGNLVAIPYTEYYKAQLLEISKLMNEAAEFADNPSLKNYLTTRAKAFLTNDYYESDMAWMDVNDPTIEVIIGPYEVYEDELFNYKASFEMFLTLVDPESTEKLKTFANYLTEMEQNLPIPQEHKNFERGSDSPIVVAQEVFSAGDTKAGVQTLAFNLPNDERVRKAKGSKKVMLKNVHQAKFDKLLKPISEIVLNQSQWNFVTFDAFFNHTLMHEMSHGLGPGFIEIDGKKTEVKKELKETYSIMEECKADILGLFNNQFMITKGVYPESFEKEMWVTFLAGVFRSIRFGVNEAHGGGNAIIYNYLLENGAYEFDSKTQKIKVNFDKAYPVLTDLANKVLMIQANGDYNGAKALIEKYAVSSETIKILVEKLNKLPVDITPTFQIEKM
ncbi:MAG: peptidase [Bacteroidetes bacterium]|nr:peptidase [Bacteroidota bacterium]MBU1800305.1 peptidase [Bacteroidota bacterium]